MMQSINCLYLLIGTNPLSNYIVADYFINIEKNVKEIHFLYSAEDLENNIQSSEPFALNLKSVLKKSSSVEFHLHAISIKDAFSIHHDVYEILSNLKNQKNVHLDFSGGTKEMALHSYETFREVFGSNVTFSYFDSRQNCLKKDSGPNEKTTFVFLQNKIRIGFSDLFRLHGYEIISGEKGGSVFSVQFFKDFLDLIRTREKFCEYLRWKEHFIQIYPNPKEIEPAEEQNKLNDLLPPDFEISEDLKNRLFLKIYNAAPEYSFFEKSGDEWILKRKLGNKQQNKLSETRKYISGYWFEQYVYTILKENLFDTGFISSIDLNLLIQTAEKNFEIDVALIKGYEFCGISCTTDTTQSLCKSKGFEILHRTKQIAGENSKAILMTFMNEKNTKEVDEDLSDVLEDRILVLGLKDLFPTEMFCEKVKEFLEI
jgi:Domain of unknown function (DUF1887).